MKVIIAGSRSIDDMSLLEEAVEQFGRDKITTVVCGMARGADLLGKEWAEHNAIDIVRFPADWSLGKRAGFVRNEQMGRFADALIALWDGKSRGTAHMIRTMKALRKPVLVLRP